jgi:hypothetical protein
MAAVHEVIARDGSCLYRGRDVELACEVYDAAPAGTRLRCRRVWTAADERRRGELSTTDAPVPYGLTPAGHAVASRWASRRADQRDVSARASRDASPPPLDEPIPYALTDRATAELFVVDTVNVAELRRRCPELFAPRPQRPTSSIDWTPTTASR